jgi:hypothetical protein
MRSSCDYLKVVARRLMASLVTATHRWRVPVFVDPGNSHVDMPALRSSADVSSGMATNLRIRTNGDARRAAEVFRGRQSARAC